MSQLVFSLLLFGFKFIFFIRYRPLRPQPIFNFNRKPHAKSQRRDDEVPTLCSRVIVSWVNATRAVSRRVGRCVYCLSIHVSFMQRTPHFPGVIYWGRSHVGSVRSCVDIIRQGRGSLVTTIEIYKIIALNCLVNAFVLSVSVVFKIVKCLNPKPV